MKITITGYNPFGIIDTEVYDYESATPFVTGLMPLSITIEAEGKESHIRFDYETPEEEEETTE